eukprot:COSAG01_NODE_3894_length_5575_cov_746.141136_8_plen_151_part_00
MHRSKIDSGTVWPAGPVRVWEAGAVWDCEQEAGEIIFVPDEFSHAVLNDGLVMGVAVQVDLGGTTALHDAAAWGKFGEQYATQLLQAGADPDTFSIVGYTPLHVGATPPRHCIVAPATAKNTPTEHRSSELRCVGVAGDSMQPRRVGRRT